MRAKTQVGGSAIMGLVVAGLFLWALGSTACGEPKRRPDPGCIKAKFAAACVQACSKLDGAVVIDTPYSRHGWADCTCAANLRGSNAGWDDHRSFKIRSDDVVPGHEWDWHECWRDSGP